MVKRSAQIEEVTDTADDRVVSRKVGSSDLPPSASRDEGDIDMGEFEDQYSDEFESDGEIIQMDGDEENEDEQDGDEDFMEKNQQKAQELVNQDQAAEQNQQNAEQQLYLPHMSRPLGPDEVLEADPTVYEMLHNVNLPWPCLSLDIVPDKLGSERRNYPQSLLLTTATQASKKKDNELLLLKMSQLAKTLVKDDNNEEEDDDDEDEDQDPIVENENIPLKDTTNRLKVSPFASESPEKLTATMSENGEVYIFDLGPQVKAFETPGYQLPKTAKNQYIL